MAEGEVEYVGAAVNDLYIKGDKRQWPVIFGQTRCVGALHSLTTSSSTEVSLGTVVLEANSLVDPGASVRITCRGRGNAATAPKLRVKFGGTYIDANVAMGSSDNFVFNAEVWRKGSANTQGAHSDLHYGTTNPGGHQYGTNINPTETETSNITIDIRGLTGGGTSLLVYHVTVELIIPPRA
jgi:hypothetical protein